MIRRTILLYVLFTVFVIQADFSFGSPPMKRGDLQLLLSKSLNVQDCVRVVPFTGPLPIRYRRSSEHIQKKFRCIIKLN